VMMQKDAQGPKEELSMVEGAKKKNSKSCGLGIFFLLSFFFFFGMMQFLWDVTVRILRENFEGRV
jgi:hypothetical protein